MLVGILAVLFGIMVLYIMQRVEDCMEKVTMQIMSWGAILGGIISFMAFV